MLLREPARPGAARRGEGEAPDPARDRTCRLIRGPTAGRPEAAAPFASSRAAPPLPTRAARAYFSALYLGYHDLGEMVTPERDGAHGRKGRDGIR